MSKIGRDFLENQEGYGRVYLNKKYLSLALLLFTLLSCCIEKPIEKMKEDNKTEEIIILENYTVKEAYVVQEPYIFLKNISEAKIVEKEMIIEEENSEILLPRDSEERYEIIKGEDDWKKFTVTHLNSTIRIEVKAILPFQLRIERVKVVWKKDFLPDSPRMEGRIATFEEEVQLEPKDYILIFNGIKGAQLRIEEVYTTKKKETVFTTVLVTTTEEITKYRTVIKYKNVTRVRIKNIT